MSRRHAATIVFLLAATAPAGCGTRITAPSATAPSSRAVPALDDAADVAAERAKLAPADRELVDAQEWCVVSTDEQLGSMGPPVKLDIRGQAVFVCCKSCQRRAEADPAKTLATADAHKALRAAGK